MSFKAACVQLNSGIEVARNIATVERLVREAASAGATYVQTPEMTNIVQRKRSDLAAAISLPADDPTLAAASALAGEMGITLHIGSLALDAGGGKIANRAFVFGPDGAVLAEYDKIHLYDADLPGGESWRESKVFTGGEQSPVVNIGEARLGVTICYDIRFPALYRALAHAGADVLSAPAAFTRQTGLAHWHVLQRARAIENGAFVISAAQAGLHEDGRETYGHSIIVSPWGEVLAEAGDTGEGVIVAEIDIAKAADARARIPVLKNERPFGVTLCGDGNPARRAAS